MSAPRAACEVTPQGAALVDRHSRIGGAQGSDIAAHGSPLQNTTT